MENLKGYIEECEQNFQNSINKIIKLKEVIEKNRNLSQTKIGKLIDRTQGYVSLTIREYNRDENEMKGTEEVNYFYQYNDIEEAEYIKKIKKMMSDTKNDLTLPIIENSKLIEKYNVTYRVTQMYRFYLLNNQKQISQIDYYNMLPDEIKEKSSITIEEILKRKPKTPTY